MPFADPFKAGRTNSLTYATKIFPFLPMHGHGLPITYQQEYPKGHEEISSARLAVTDDYV